MDEGTFGLSYPLCYLGSETDRLHYDGHPLGARITSVYDSYTRQISIDEVGKGSARIELDIFNGIDLKVEALAYYIRAESYMSPHANWGINPQRALRDTDQAVRILNMLCNHSNDPKLHEAAREILDEVMGVQNAAMVYLAVRSRNYLWAKKIVRLGMEAADSQDVVLDGEGETALAKHSDRHGDLEGLLGNIIISARNESLPRLNLIPADIPVESSYATRLNRVVELQQYEQAAKEGDALELIVDRINSLSRGDYFSWVTLRLLTHVFEAGTSFKLKSDKLIIYDVDGKEDVRVYRKGVDPPSFVIKNRAHHAAILGFIHELPFVLRFERLDTRVRIMADGRLIKGNYNMMAAPEETH